jgi:hypothetical protein
MTYQDLCDLDITLRKKTRRKRERPGKRERAIRRLWEDYDNEVEETKSTRRGVGCRVWGLGFRVH